MVFNFWYSNNVYAAARVLDYDKTSIFIIYTLQWIGTYVRCIKGDEIQYVHTRPLAQILESTVRGGGEVVYAFFDTIEEKCVCWSTTSSPGIFNDCSSDESGMGDYMSNMTGLSPNTTYYVRAYVKVGGGVYYGAQRMFTTTFGE